MHFDIQSPGVRDAGEKTPRLLLIANYSKQLLTSLCSDASLAFWTAAQVRCRTRRKLLRIEAEQVEFAMGS